MKGKEPDSHAITLDALKVKQRIKPFKARNFDDLDRFIATRPTREAGFDRTCQANFLYQISRVKYSISQPELRLLQAVTGLSFRGIGPKDKAGEERSYQAALLKISQKIDQIEHENRTGGWFGPRIFKKRVDHLKAAHNYIEFHCLNTLTTKYPLETNNGLPEFQRSFFTSQKNSKNKFLLAAAKLSRFFKSNRQIKELKKLYEQKTAKANTLKLKADLLYTQEASIKRRRNDITREELNKGGFFEPAHLRSELEHFNEESLKFSQEAPIKNKLNRLFESNKEIVYLIAEIKQDLSDIGLDTANLSDNSAANNPSEDPTVDSLAREYELWRQSISNEGPIDSGELVKIYQSALVLQQSLANRLTSKLNLYKLLTLTQNQIQAIAANLVQLRLRQDFNTPAEEKIEVSNLLLEAKELDKQLRSQANQHNQCLMAIIKVYEHTNQALHEIQASNPSSSEEITDSLNNFLVSQEDLKIAPNDINQLSDSFLLQLTQQAINTLYEDLQKELIGKNIEETKKILNNKIEHLETQLQFYLNQQTWYEPKATLLITQAADTVKSMTYLAEKTTPFLNNTR
jgi:hypothetical protein